MAFPLLNLDVFWNSSRAWAYKFQETPELGETPLPPSTKAIILTCIDARIFPQQIFGLKMGEAHVIRNAGGVAEAALRDIVVSQQFLGTEEIFIVKHEDCGMLTATNAEFLQGLKTSSESKDADFSRAGYQSVKKLPFFGIKSKGLEQALAEDVAFLENHPAIKKNTVVHGFIYNVHDGRTRQLYTRGVPVPAELQYESARNDAAEFVLEVSPYGENREDPLYAQHLYDRVALEDDPVPEEDAKLEPRPHVICGTTHPMAASVFTHATHGTDTQPPGSPLGRGGSKAGGAGVSTRSAAAGKKKVGPAKGPKKAAAVETTPKKRLTGKDDWEGRGIGKDVNWEWDDDDQLAEYIMGWDPRERPVSSKPSTAVGEKLVAPTAKGPEKTAAPVATPKKRGAPKKKVVSEEAEEEVIPMTKATTRAKDRVAAMKEATKTTESAKEAAPTKAVRKAVKKGKAKK